MTPTHAATRTDSTVTCWKCIGKRNLPHFSHVAGGVCFTCGGTGVCDVSFYLNGLEKDHGCVSYWFGKNGGGLTLAGGGAGAWGGLVDMPRQHALGIIKNHLEFLAAEERTADAWLEVAIRVACVGGERVWERAARASGDAARFMALRHGAEQIVDAAKAM